MEGKVQAKSWNKSDSECGKEQKKEVKNVASDRELHQIKQEVNEKCGQDRTHTDNRKTHKEDGKWAKQE